MSEFARSHDGGKITNAVVAFAVPGGRSGTVNSQMFFWLGLMFDPNEQERDVPLQIA